MNFLQRYALSIVLALLQASIKNPKSLAKEAGILTEARDNINTILAGISA